MSKTGNFPIRDFIEALLMAYMHPLLVIILLVLVDKH